MIYDYIILGCGPAGYSAAINLKNFNNKILCIEKKKIGGECLNYGCIPSKIFIEMSKNNSNNYFIKKKIISFIAKNMKKNLKNMGIKLIENNEGLVNKDFVSIKNNKFFFKKLIICTGSKSKKIHNIDNDLVLTNRTVFNIKKIPKSVIFIGFGIISIELGFMFNNFGSKVIILEKKKKVLDFLDKDIVYLLKKKIKENNIKVYKGVDSIGAIKNKSKTEVNFCFKNKQKKIMSDILVVSIGRKPCFGKKQNKVGIKLNNDGFIKVNSYFMTNVKNIYAIGDSIGSPFLAYKSENDAFKLSRILNNNILVKDSIIPFVIFSNPEISWVGEVEQNLKKGDFFTTKFNLSNNVYAKIKNINFGFLKLIFNKSMILIGAHLFFENSQEIIFSLYLLIKNKVNIFDIKGLYYIHPSIHESIRYLVSKL